MTPEQFKQARKVLGYSASLLADRWGLTPGAIYHWESGRTPSPGVVVDALAFVATLPPPVKSLMLTAEERYRVGARFGRLVVIGSHAGAGKRKYGRFIQVTVECDCGNINTVRSCCLNARRQCSSKCPLADQPFPPCTPAPCDPAGAFTFPEIAPPAPREGLSHRAKIKHGQLPQSVEERVWLKENGQPVGETAEEAHARYTQAMRTEARNAAKAEAEDADKAIEASWEEGLADDDDEDFGL